MKIFDCGECTVIVRFNDELVILARHSHQKLHLLVILELPITWIAAVRFV
jgi:hypothetical protein